MPLGLPCNRKLTGILDNDGDPLIFVASEQASVIEFFQNAPWHHLYNFFADGNPPLVVRVLILNTIFLLVYIFRRARGVSMMGQKTALQVQVFLIAANALMLFEPEIMSGLRYIDRFI